VEEIKAKKKPPTAKQLETDAKRRGGYLIPLLETRVVQAGKELLVNKTKVGNAQEAAEVMKPLFAGLSQRCYYALWLDAYFKPIGASLIAAGSKTDMSVDEPYLFRTAMQVQAVHFVVGHNHADQEPLEVSQADRVHALALRHTARMHGLTMLDSIVYARDPDLWLSVAKSTNDAETFSVGESVQLGDGITAVKMPEMEEDEIKAAMQEVDRFMSGLIDRIKAGAFKMGPGNAPGSSNVH